jgi:hypothetical protein
MRQHILFSLLLAVPFISSAQGTDTTRMANPPAQTAPVPPATQPVNATAVPATGVAVAPAPPAKPPKINRVRFGAYIAPTMNWMKPTTSTSTIGSTTYDVKSGGDRAGFIYGLMMDYWFAENYAFATGLQVNQTGGQIVATNHDQSIQESKILKSDFTYRLQYIEIPVNLKLRTDDMNKVRFFGQAGLSLGINISRKVDYDVSYVPNGGTAAKDTSREKVKLTGNIDAVAPVMLQMNLGAGIEYVLTPKLSGYVAFFFNNGFAPDATKPQNFKNMGYPVTFDDGNTRLNNIALRLGLFF